MYSCLVFPAIAELLQVEGAFEADLTPASQLVRPDESCFERLEEGFEIKHAVGRDTETLDNLGAYCDGPEREC